MRFEGAMEPLLHFAVPFAIVSMLRLRLKWSFIVGLLGILPDFDLLFSMHRSVSHSIIPAITLFLASLLLRKKKRGFILQIIALGWGSHTILDFIGSYTPILWPLSSQSHTLFFESRLSIEGSPSIHLRLEVLEEEYDYGLFTTFDAPLLTLSGLTIGLILITLSLYLQFGYLGKNTQKKHLKN
ncbi:MAG: metal-dependent hydrolase [Nitrososphaerales archaeon]